MTGEERERVNRIIEAVLYVPPDQRGRAIGSLCPADEDESIREEVQRLVEEDAQLAERLAKLGLPSSHVTPVPAVETVPASNGEEHSADGTAESVPAKPAHGIDHLPPLIGRYRIRSRLGSGGMGQVYLAEQPAPIRQTVALKLIKSGFDTLDVIARFEAERQVLSRMDHPNIARILDAGSTDTGRPFFVMEFVPGKPITEFAEEHRLSIPQRLQLFMQVCDAVAHAHTKGVIHRDLKPSNVLAWMDDGVPRVKVIDFGIAKALTGDGLDAGATIYTQAGTVLGTYEYMSPEQASSSTDIDTRTDVYSLGVMLYEIVSGLRPFERREMSGHTDEELRRIIREIEPPRPSTRFQHLDSAPLRDELAANRQMDATSLVRTLERELEWIPLKAMRKERDRRYRSANALAADVANYLEGRALTAAPESRFYLIRKTVTRYRAPIAVGVAVMVLLAAAVVGTSFGLAREATARRAAEASRLRADRSAYRSAIAAAEVALQNADGVRLRWALDSAPESLRGWEWKAFNWAAHTKAIQLAARDGERFTDTVLLPDSRRAWSTAGTGAESVQWDLFTGTILRREKGLAIVDPSDRTYAVVRSNGAIEVIDNITGDVRWRAEPLSGDTPWQLSENAFSLDGRLLVAWDGKSSNIALFDVENGTSRTLTVGALPSSITGFIDFQDANPTGRLVFNSDAASGTFQYGLEDGVSTRITNLLLIDGRRAIPRGSVVRQLRSVATGARVFLPQRGMLAIGRGGGSISVYRLQQVTTDEILSGTPIEIDRIIVGAVPIRALVATPNERLFVATLSDGSVHVMPVDVAPQIPYDVFGITAIEPAPDFSRVAALGWGDVQCFEPFSGLPIWGRNLGRHSNRHGAWSPDGKLLAIATNPSELEPETGNSELFILDGQTGKQLAAWSVSAVTLDPTHDATPEWGGSICAVTFNADGSVLWIAKRDGTLARLDAHTWKPLPGEAPKSPPPVSGPPHHPYRSALKLSPDGSRLAHLICLPPAGDRLSRGSLVMRDPKSAAIQSAIELPGYAPTAVAWSPNSKSIAVGFGKALAATLVVFDAATGAKQFQVESPDGSAIVTLCYSRDGSRIVATTPTQTIFVDTASGEPILAATSSSVLLDSYFTPQNMLVTIEPRKGLVITETSDLELHFSDVMKRWPAGVEKPATLTEARRWVGDSMSIFTAVYDSSESMEQTIAKRTELPAAVAALTRAVADAHPPSINSLNNAGLTRLWKKDPSQEELTVAAKLFEKAVSLKPHSPTLQENLGAARFEIKDYRGSREALEAAERLRAEAGTPPAPASLIRIAIVARQFAEPEAENLYRRAIDETIRQSKSEDSEVKPLREKARTIFGF